MLPHLHQSALIDFVCSIISLSIELFVSFMFEFFEFIGFLASMATDSHNNGVLPNGDTSRSLNTSDELQPSYFISSSDHPGFSVVLDPLNGVNYSTWSKRL